MKKKILSILMGICMIACLLSIFSISVSAEGNKWDGTVASSFAGGTGTIDDPYQIADGSQLAYIGRDGQSTTNVYYKLTSNISLNDLSVFIKDENGIICGVNDNYSPLVWHGAYSFDGVLDGDGHTISGLYCNASSSSHGLFSRIGASGEVKNLTMANGYVCGASNGGTFAERNNGTMTNCMNSVGVSASMYIGGITGWNFGTIRNCINTGYVISENSGGDIGGIAGINGGTIIKCTNYGEIVGQSGYSGGITGSNSFSDPNSSTVAQCVNYGRVMTTGNYGGGIAGFTYGLIVSCSNSGSIVGTETGSSAGIVGAATGESGIVEGCWNSGKVDCESDFYGGGGIVAKVYENSTVTHCYSYGEITGTAKGAFGSVDTSAIIDTCYYNSDICTLGGAGEGKSTDYLKSSDYISLLNDYCDTSRSDNLLYWTVDLSSINNGYPIFTTDNTYTVTVFYNNGGYVTPSKGIEILEGHYKTFSFTTDYGYKIGDVLVDGVSIGPEDSYTFSLISANHSIEVIFEPDGSIANGFAAGTGSVDDPYRIETMAQMAFLAQQVNGGNGYNGQYFELTNDITFNSIDKFTTDSDGKITGIVNTDDIKEWMPIGSGHTFNGVFDGKNHTIYGIYCNDKYSSDCGLFGNLGSYIANPGTVKNQTIANGYIKNTSGGAGGIVNHGSQAPIENCHNINVTVIGTVYTGGITGYPGAIIKNCTNSGNIFGSSDVGGIAGYADSIIHCTNTGSVRATWANAGGIAGLASTIQDCINSGTVELSTGGYYNGAAAGIVATPLISVLNCINTGDVVSAGQQAGGIVGALNGSGGVFANCYSTGSISGGSKTYAVIGAGRYDNYTCNVTNCYYLPDSFAGITDLYAEGLTSDEFKSENILNELNSYVKQNPSYNLSYWIANALTGYPVLYGHSVSVGCNNEDFGTVSGGGIFSEGSLVTVRAEALSGYSFVNWSEGDVVISADPNYEFIVSINRNLVANFTPTHPTGVIDHFIMERDDKKIIVPLDGMDGYAFAYSTENELYQYLKGSNEYPVVYGIQSGDKYLHMGGYGGYAMNFSIYPTPLEAMENTGSILANELKDYYVFEGFDNLGNVILTPVIPKSFEIEYPITDGNVYHFKGINIGFNREIQVPTDWSPIRITDSKGMEIAIDNVRTTISAKELQVYSGSIWYGDYTIIIPANTITDMDGNKYDRDIEISFTVEYGIASMPDVDVTMGQNESYSLPSTVTAYMTDGTQKSFGVVWDSTTVDTSAIGTYTYYGTINGYPNGVKLILNVVTGNCFEIEYPITDGDIYHFKGINIGFNRDIQVPTAWSQIKITDSKGMEMPIDDIRTTISTRELQVYSHSIGYGDYIIRIPENTISDIDGNKYGKDIEIKFKVENGIASIQDIIVTVNQNDSYSLPSAGYGAYD